MRPIEIKLSSQTARQRNRHLDDYLQLIGVQPLPPTTSPFDPGYDPLTLEGHLQQSAHLMSILKISMACWMVANENITRRKIAAAKSRGVPTVTGGGPFEIAERRIILRVQIARVLHINERGLAFPFDNGRAERDPSFRL